jgi:DNA (cytosine-5)-methyltransferase 1
MNVLELFSGAGGGILGSRLLGHSTVCTVERDPYCREVLLRRQEEGHLEPFPVWDDVRTFDGRPWRDVVDIVAAGFPCQPWSSAGARRGSADERNLWPDTLRVIREVGPRFAFLENVPRLANNTYFWECILPSLAEAGFDVRWEVVSAAEVGAPHQRDRIWILGSSSRSLADACRSGLEGLGERAGGAGPQEPVPASSGTYQGRGSSWWLAEPDVGRVAHGVAARMDRLRAIGNGQVPAVAARAWGELI